LDRDATGDYRLVRATAQVNGIRLHYVLEGQGPLVVLLHGWPQTWYCWRKVIAPLADGHTVLVPDLRGYGQSDKRQVQAMVRMLLRLPSDPRPADAADALAIALTHLAGRRMAAIASR